MGNNSSAAPTAPAATPSPDQVLLKQHFRNLCGGGTHVEEAAFVACFGAPDCDTLARRLFRHVRL